MKLRAKLLLGLLIFLAAGFLCKGALAKAALSAGVRAVTGLRLEIRRMAVGVWKPRVMVEELRLFNPRGFVDPVMVDLPELTVDYDLGAFLRGHTHLRQLDLYLKELVVVKNEKGQLNLDSLTSVQQAHAQRGQRKAKPQPTTTVTFEIDELHLRIGKVIYKDYSRGGSPMIQEFSVNIDEHYSHVTDPTALGSLIVTRALFKTTVAHLAQLDLSDLNHLLEKSVDTAGDATTEAVDLLKKILPVKE